MLNRYAQFAMEQLGPLRSFEVSFCISHRRLKSVNLYQLSVVYYNQVWKMHSQQRVNLYTFIVILPSVHQNKVRQCVVSCDVVYILVGTIIMKNNYILLFFFYICLVMVLLVVEQRSSLCCTFQYTQTKTNLVKLDRSIPRSS